MRRFALIALVALTTCKGSEPNQGKRMPKAPPPPDVEIPAALHVDVERFGTPESPITAARLADVPPDYADTDRRAWRLDTLLGLQDGGSLIAVTGPDEVTVELPLRAAGEPVPVLMITRRGDIMAAMVDPDDPFPAYHGQGGRLGRPGDPLPRVMNVRRVRITRSAPLPDTSPPG